MGMTIRSRSSSGERVAASSATMALVTAPFASIGDAPLRVFVAAGLMGLIFNPIGRISYASAPKYVPVADVALFTPIETVAATASLNNGLTDVPSVLLNPISLDSENLVQVLTTDGYYTADALQY